MSAAPLLIAAVFAAHLQGEVRAVDARTNLVTIETERLRE
jgi:hypothetical protein